MHGTTTTITTLHYGDNDQPIVVIVADDCWPGMWRVVWPGGASDMANLQRAKNAARCNYAARTAAARCKFAPMANGTTRKSPGKAASSF